MDNVSASIAAMRYDIEFEYLMKRVQDLTADGATVTVYWLPRKLSENSMHFEPEQMLEWWEEGYETAFDPGRKEVFTPNPGSF